MRSNMLALLLIALLTWAGISWQLWLISAHASSFGVLPARPVVPLLCLAYAVGILWLHWLDGCPRERQRARWPLLLMLLASSALVLWRPGSTAPVLWVVLASMAAFLLDVRVLRLLLVLAVLTLYAALRHSGEATALLQTLLWGGFLAFAGLVSLYARRDQERAEDLRQLNAELLATRSLLAESARDAERLRLSRELHDVAGHGLTALRLNLLALQRDLEASPPALQQALALSSQLLQDLRGVVRQLREHDGLDLATALDALAQAVPDRRVQVTVSPGLRVANTAAAEAVLRVAQEALTNSLRHGRAGRVELRLEREGEWLRLQVDDDGQLRWPLREGNGLTGMRERLAQLGGRLALEPGHGGGLRLRAELPGVTT